MTFRSVLRLKVQQVARRCAFDLAWGKGQQLYALSHYPEALTELYQEWQRVYLSFYATSLRGRVEASGSITPPPIDWHARLVETETRLLYEFHRWLRGAELFEIRAEIARAARVLAEQAAETGERYAVELFLTCNSLELERLPWEVWEIGTEFATPGTIRIARAPSNIRVAPVADLKQRRRGRARILAILGDERGLDFQVDRQAVRALAHIAEVEFVGWQPGQELPELKAQICRALTDERGWDVLFFAGHSNETGLTGGELAIAPGASIAIREIARHLAIAQERGLQFAIFNSCSGLSLAASLIDLGLSQVAIMREPIHNQVAQEFLVQFLKGLAEHKDVHDALLAACQFLRLERNLTYPSAHLVPSLFRHPEATLFQIEPFGFKQRLKPWLPKGREVLALGACLALSLFHPVQESLMAQRLWLQAAYRDLTGQVPPAVPPPILLVQVDDESIRRSEVGNPNPIDRGYLAHLVNRLSALDAQTVALAFFLDRQQPGKDQKLAEAVRAAVARGTWFVFGTRLDEAEHEVDVNPKVASLDWSLQAYTDVTLWYVELPPAQSTCLDTCPFPYLLSLVQALKQSSLAAGLPQPNLRSPTDLRERVLAHLQRSSTALRLQAGGSDARLTGLAQLRLPAITSLVQKKLDQVWLQPVVDFSLPPDRVYQRIAAWQLLERQPDRATAQRLRDSIVLIGAGGYADADRGNFPVPPAFAYWNQQRQVFTGAEAHAYMLHHLLTHHLVIPIPDLWMVGLAALFGKLTCLSVRHQRHQRGWLLGLAGATVAYGLVGLQTYISAGVLLPWFLPSATFWVYTLPGLRRKPRA